MSRGASRPITNTAAHQAPKKTHDAVLIVSGVTVWPACCQTSQRLPRSAPRFSLNVQKTFHCSWPVRYAGALASTHVPSAATDTRRRSGHDRRRRQITRIPPSRKSG